MPRPSPHLIAFTCVVALAGCGGRRIGRSAVAVKAHQWPQADVLFHRDPRWLGSDAAYSVPLPDGRILWLFNDTLVATTGSLPDFVRNTIAIEHGANPVDATTILVAFAGTIEGPWSKARTFFRPPESNVAHANVYAAKGHPELRGADLAGT